MAIITAFPGGEAPATLPEFTYTGNYTLIDDGDGNWRIKFLTSGTLTFTDKNWNLDVYKVGGGASGAYSNNAYWGGSGGGYTSTTEGVVALKNTAYPIVIGAGGAAKTTQGNGNPGGATSAFGYSVNGGAPGVEWGSGAGGSGGGGRENGTGGSNGSNGLGTSPGAGQGTTTREFAEAGGDLYSPGGGGSTGGAKGAGLTGANSGAGGNTRIGGGEAGGSGIVVIRNHRAA